MVVVAAAARRSKVGSVVVRTVTQFGHCDRDRASRGRKWKGGSRECFLGFASCTFLSRFLGDYISQGLVPLLFAFEASCHSAVVYVHIQALCILPSEESYQVLSDSTVSVYTMSEGIKMLILL
jgi:hypothetical protein